MADIVALSRVRRRLQRMRINAWRLRDRDNPFETEEDTFSKKFRLFKMAVKDLVEELRPHMRAIENGYSVEMQVLSSLYVLGSGSFQHVASASCFSQISQSSVSRFLKQFIDAVRDILPHHIQFPITAAELLNIKSDFFTATGFPNCVGAIECSHFNIVRPTEPDYFVFLNRKSRFSINVQMVCDFNLKILDVVARWPGSVHDSFIWRGSSLRDLSGWFYPREEFFTGGQWIPTRTLVDDSVSRGKSSKKEKI